MEKQTCFVAEVDPGGSVAWVWRLGPEDRCARPLSCPDEHLEELTIAEVFGATRSDVRNWIARQLSVGG